jgi:ABC-type multidrug transport system ATPase subunit
MTTPLLSAQGLCHGWPGHTLFDQLSLTLPPGLTLLLGGDGSGKTTLLRLLSGQQMPQAGQITLAAALCPDSHATHALQHTVFWLHPDDPALNQHHNTPARDALHAQLAAWPQARLQDVPALCEALSLTPHLDKPMYMLSTGSRRKVWLAAALCAHAPVTLLETPLAALDAPSSRALVNAVMAQAKPGATPPRAWLWADYQTPEGLHPANTLSLRG